MKCPYCQHELEYESEPMKIIRAIYESIDPDTIPESVRKRLPSFQKLSIPDAETGKSESQHDDIKD